MTSSILVVLCTVPNKDTASKISSALIEQKLAACVQISADIESCYMWNGKVENTSEVAMMIKSIHEHGPNIEQSIKTLHPYELPEILFHNLEASTDYANWVYESCSPSIAI